MLIFTFELTNKTSSNVTTRTLVLANENLSLQIILFTSSTRKQVYIYLSSGRLDFFNALYVSMKSKALHSFIRINSNYFISLQEG